jgi:nucleotidyltransferase/DNA polymerase involved in DNA repair
MGAGQTGEYVDKRYEDRDINELPDAPVEALRGLGTRGAEALRKAFGVKTIRDLATNDFVLKAQEVVRLAERPTALPAVAPSPLAAGVDATEVVRDPERPLPVRRERVEADRPDWER